MSEQHTPEPWPVFTDIATTMTPDPEGTPVAILSWDDYIRARACVNACAGFSIEELEGASLFNDSISAQDEIDSLKSEVEEMKLIIATDTGTESAVAAMQDELHESDQLRERMDILLTRTACALKGQPDELTMHSWHDLPEAAENIRRQRDELLAALEHILAGSLSLPRFAEAEAIAVIASVKANT